MFNDVFEEEFSIIKPMLEALRENDKAALKDCSDIVIPNIESGLLNGFDHLKARALKRTKRVEMGDASQSDIVNNAIETLVSMGLAEDIVKPLVQDCIASNPDVSLIDIIHQATSSFASISSIEGQTPSKEKSANKKRNSKVIKTKQTDWGQLPVKDLRKTHFSKTGGMYEALLDEGHIFPINSLLAG